MIAAPEPSIHPLSREAWRAWLCDNHHRTTGVWLVSYKKGTGKPRFDYDAGVEEALCFGWIDSKPNKLDAERAPPCRRRTGCVKACPSPVRCWPRAALGPSASDPGPV